jgi:acylphosphatase
MKEFEAIISGKVQAVNFRNFVKQKADALWLAGTVENLPDFKVRVVAQGPEDKLEKFIGHLHKGPFNAKVLNVDVAWKEPSEEMRGFKIIY